MRRHSRGFTLIEMAVAVAILGIGVVTLQQIYQGALRLQDRASRQGRAVLHARAAMDSLLTPPYIADGTTEQTTQEGFRTRILVRHATPEEGGEDAEREFDVESEQGLRYVEVEVAWSDGGGMKTYTLRSLRMAAEESDE